MPLVFSLNVMCYETATICKSLAHLVCLLQVYGLAMYVEEAAARQEVSRLKGAGFFADGESSVEKMCSAISAMNCHKVVQLQLMRSISSSQFTGALADSLKPRLQGTPAYDLIPDFERFFEAKTLASGANVPIMQTGGLSTTVHSKE